MFVTRLDVKLIINLQNKGDHPFCGPNKRLELSGYMYEPELLRKEGIQVEEVGWEVRHKNKIDSLFQIARLIAAGLEEGTVFIHCHGGNSRSCLAVLCFMLFRSVESVPSLINFLKLRRNTAFKDGNIANIYLAFQERVSKLRTVFPPSPISLEETIGKQSEMLFGLFGRENITVPLFLRAIFDKFAKLLDENIVSPLKLVKIMLAKSEVSSLETIKEKLNIWEWSALEDSVDCRLLARLLFDWLENSVIFIVNPYKLSKIDVFSNTDLKNISLKEANSLVNTLEQVLSEYEISCLVCSALLLSKLKENSISFEFMQLTGEIALKLIGYKTADSMQDDAKRIELISQAKILRKVLLVVVYQVENDYNYCLKYSSLTKPVNLKKISSVRFLEPQAVIESDSKEILLSRAMKRLTKILSERESARCSSNNANERNSTSALNSAINGICSTGFEKPKLSLFSARNDSSMKESDSSRLSSQSENLNSS